MKNESGSNLLNENLKQHKPFKLFYKGEYWADFDYDEEKKVYQSNYGYLTVEGIYKIIKDEDDERNILFY